MAADILFVEDNKELSDLISLFFKKEGYQVQIALNGEEAVEYVKEHAVKLMILDLMLPGLDGFAVCDLVRKKCDIPIIVMSAIIDKEDKMKCFELGADDYIEKPCDIDLLLAKVKALLLRSYRKTDRESILEVGDLCVDLESRSAKKNGEVLELNVKEYELLVLLMKNVGKTLSKEFLFNEIWGSDSFSENQTLTVHIKRLRNRIEDDPKKPNHILTVWGVGYQFEEV